ncbi:MAG: glycosyltransferase family 2 protein [Lachnospiraceae bacterium]|nr:glycosyltransferase family 2 protein [Lachnospiraceae bacterium]
MELVSVIVPVYQVREYLMECVQSIQEQTYTELEIILVDDGSTDGSEKICDKCVINDKRISVIHQKNQGLSVARNNGLRHAKGRLIAFVDADDVVDERYIEVLYEILAKYEADIAVCDYVRFRTGEGYYTHRKKGELLISSQTMLRQWHGTSVDMLLNRVDIFLRMQLRNWLFSVWRADGYDWQKEKEIVKRAIEDSKGDIT